MYKIIKRIMDVIVCLMAFPFFCIIWFFAAILIKSEDGGPVFYKAERIGKDGKKIFMYKFRSMRVNAPDIRNEDGSTYNAKDDARVTKIGKLLRETSLDETAQILNVLKGDMSIIGPRASGWGALDSYLPDEVDKIKVRPGITGYTQAYFRNSISAREKRLKDAWYANNVSLWLDVKIFFKTIQTVFKRENVYTNDANATVEEVKTESEQKSEVNLEKTADTK